MKKESANKKQRIIRRFHNRSSVGAMVSQKQIDVALTGLVLSKLYNNGDKQPASLKEDILIPSQIKFTNQGVDRLWDILLSTGLVSPVIGFGHSGQLSITNQGYQLMSQFGSYTNFIKKREEAVHQESGGDITQFIQKKNEEEPDTEVQEGNGDIKKSNNKKGEEGNQKGTDSIAARKKKE
jgi:hypothetical protein